MDDSNHDDEIKEKPSVSSQTENNEENSHPGNHQPNTFDRNTSSGVYSSNEEFASPPTSTHSLNSVLVGSHSNDSDIVYERFIQASHSDSMLLTKSASNALYDSATGKDLSQLNNDVDQCPYQTYRRARDRDLLQNAGLHEPITGGMIAGYNPEYANVLENSPEREPSESSSSWLTDDDQWPPEQAADDDQWPPEQAADDDQWPPEQAADDDQWPPEQAADDDQWPPEQAANWIPIGHTDEEAPEPEEDWEDELIQLPAPNYARRQYIVTTKPKNKNRRYICSKQRLMTDDEKVLDDEKLIQKEEDHDAEQANANNNSQKKEDHDAEQGNANNNSQKKEDHDAEQGNANNNAQSYFSDEEYESRANSIIGDEEKEERDAFYGNPFPDLTLCKNEIEEADIDHDVSDDARKKDGCFVRNLKTCAVGIIATGIVVSAILYLRRVTATKLINIKF